MTAAAVTEAFASSAGPPLLRIQNLHKSFGGVRAVSEISLDVPTGSIFAVIGPNGAGKSTLLNLISGVYQPDFGSIALNGQDLAGMRSYQRVRLGLARTFQKIRLFRQLSVLDNVIAGFHVHHKIPVWQYVIHGAAFAHDRRLCRDEARRLLEFFGMTSRLDVLAGELSYGEQRMLELARSLASRPRLLLIDEPAAGLNAAEVDVLLDRIRTLRGEGITVIVVEHNMNLVMNVADRIMVMDYGRHLFQGTPSEVQKDPSVIAAYLGGELS